MPNEITSCPIWGNPHPATGYYSPGQGICEVTGSPRAGGGYLLPYGFKDEIDDFTASLSLKQKAMLTTWLIDQRTHGASKPRITEEIIEYTKIMSPLPVHERSDRLLRFIASQMETVATSVVIDQETHPAYTWSESINWDEVVYLLNYLAEMRWIQGQRTGDGRLYGGLTVDGHSRIAERQVNVDSSQAFVAMWFDDSMTAVSRDGIEPGIRDAGYDPLIINRKEHISKIDDEIIAEIRRSRFVMADFTHGDKGPRGGVYYEAGFAHGLDIPVIFTCRKDCFSNLHFDTNHYNHIDWSTPEELHEKLKNRILAVIGEGPKAHRKA